MDSEKQAPRDWQEVLEELQQLNVQEKTGVLRMGDVFAEIEDTHGREKVWEAASTLRMTKSSAKQRLWVSRQIPVDHWLRESHLSYTHLRVIAGTEDIERWGQLALDGNLSVAELSAAIEAEGTQQAVQQGEPCVRCQKPLPEIGELVAFRIGSQPRARCCNISCAALHFADLYNAQVDLLLAEENSSSDMLDPYAAAGPA